MPETLNRLLESIFIDGIRLDRLDPSSAIDGGKANYLIKAIRYLSRLSSERGEISGTLEQMLQVPITEVLPFKFFDDFVSGLEGDVKEEIRKAESGQDYDFEKIRNGFLSAPLPQLLNDKIDDILATRKRPLVVRSNSRLEDSEDAAFAGKYTTIFAGNSGGHKKGFQQLEMAIREVFASTYNKNAIVYRRDHGLLNGINEKMAVMVQDVVGEEFEIEGHRYFLPLAAGVFDSVNHNFRWSKELIAEDGFGRIVFGLGTQAVGREVNPRMYSPTNININPAVRRSNNRVYDIVGSSQKIVDAIDLKTGDLVHLDVQQLIQSSQIKYPGSEKLISLIAGMGSDNPRFVIPGNYWSYGEDHGCLTFNELLTTPIGEGKLTFPRMQIELSRLLEKGIGHQVDSEFACNQDSYYLLQSRPLSQRKEFQPGYVPYYAANDPMRYMLFRVKKNVPSREIKEIKYIVYVDADAYYKLSMTTNTRGYVANLLGSIDSRLGKDNTHILIGPSRLGTEDESLGIPIEYRHFSNSPALVEYSFTNGEVHLPDPSYGSHLFRDLIEFHITFVPLMPDDEKYSFLRDDIMRGGEDQDPENKNGLKGVVYILDLGKMFNTTATLALDGKSELGGLYLERREGARTVHPIKQ